MEEFIIVCDGGCGKTTQDITTSEKGKFEPVEQSLVPKWTCDDCLAKRQTNIILRGKHLCGKKSKKQN